MTFALTFHFYWHRQTARMHEYTQTQSDHVWNGCNPTVTDRDFELSVEWELNNSMLITAVHTSMNNPNTVRVPGGMECMHTGNHSSCNTHTHVHREKALDVEEEGGCVLYSEKQAHCLKLAASTKVWDTHTSYRHTCYTNTCLQLSTTTKWIKARKCWYVCFACCGLGAIGVFGGRGVTALPPLVQ